MAGGSLALTLGFRNAGELEVKVEITDVEPTDHSRHGEDRQGRTQ